MEHSYVMEEDEEDSEGNEYIPSMSLSRKKKSSRVKIANRRSINKNPLDSSILSDNSDSIVSSSSLPPYGYINPPSSHHNYSFDAGIEIEDLPEEKLDNSIDSYQSSLHSFHRSGEEILSSDSETETSQLSPDEIKRRLGIVNSNDQDSRIPKTLVPSAHEEEVDLNDLKDAFKMSVDRKNSEFADRVYLSRALRFEAGAPNLADEILSLDSQYISWEVLYEMSFPYLKNTHDEHKLNQAKDDSYEILPEIINHASETKSSPKFYDFTEKSETYIEYSNKIDKSQEDIQASIISYDSIINISDSSDKSVQNPTNLEDSIDLSDNEENKSKSEYYTNTNKSNVKEISKTKNQSSPLYSESNRSLSPKIKVDIVRRRTISNENNIIEKFSDDILSQEEQKKSTSPLIPLVRKISSGTRNIVVTSNSKFHPDHIDSEKETMPDKENDTEADDDKNNNNNNNNNNLDLNEIKSQTLYSLKNNAVHESSVSLAEVKSVEESSSLVIDTDTDTEIVPLPLKQSLERSPNTTAQRPPLAPARPITSNTVSLIQESSESIMNNYSKNQAKFVKDFDFQSSSFDFGTNFKPEPLSVYAKSSGYIYEGFLEKKSSKTGFWLKRYFVLSESADHVCVLLQYGKAVDSVWGKIPIELKKIIPLCYIESVEISSKPQEFTVVESTGVNSLNVMNTKQSTCSSLHSHQSSDVASITSGSVGSESDSRSHTHKLRAPTPESRLYWITILQRARAFRNALVA